MSDVKSYATHWDALDDIYKGVPHTEMRVTVSFLDKDGKGESHSLSDYYPTEMIKNGPFPLAHDPYAEAQRLAVMAVQDQYRKVWTKE